MINRVNYFKLSILYSALAALPPVLQLFIQPIIEGADRLSAIDFSHIGIAEQVTSLSFTIVLFSMSAALSRFYYDCTDSKEKYNKLVAGTLLSILIRGAFLLLIAFSFRNIIGSIFSQPELQNFSTYGFASIAIGINRAIYMSAAALYRNEKRVKSFVILNIALAIFRSAFQIVGVLFWDMSFLGYVYGTLVGSSVVSMAILIITLRKTGIVYDREFMKPVHQFANPLFQYAIISWALYFVDKYFLESTPSVLGIYITAMNFANGIQLIIQGVQAATQPEVFRYMKEGINHRQVEIRALGNMLMVQTQLIIAFAIVPTIAYIHEFFETDIQLAASFISIIFVRFIPRSQYFVYSFVLFFEKKTRILFILNTINLVLTIGLNYALIPTLGIYGAVIAVLISELVLMLGVYFYSQRECYINWNLKKTLVAPLACLAIIVLFEVVKQFIPLSVYVWGSLSTLTILLGVAFAYQSEIKKLIAKL